MDMTILSFLAAPFVASLVIAGIHAYLGVHVVERGVIFVDLSLAQIAAFGATIAILLPWSGGDPHGPAVYWVSLLFTFIGAAIFSTIRSQPRADSAGGDHRHLLRGGVGGDDPGAEQVDRGGEHLKDMLVGNILAVSWEEVWRTATSTRSSAPSTGCSARSFWPSRWTTTRRSTRISVRLWDFLFYASFGFVVTRSVAIAGVLLVFCYLIVPSVAAMLFADRIGPRLAIGWTMGTVVSALGVYLVADAGLADRRDDRVHVRAGADPDGARPRPGCRARQGRRIMSDSTAA